MVFLRALKVLLFPTNTKCKPAFSPFLHLTQRPYRSEWRLQPKQLCKFTTFWFCALDSGCALSGTGTSSNDFQLFFAKSFDSSSDCLCSLYRTYYTQMKWQGLDLAQASVAVVHSIGEGTQGHTKIRSCSLCCRQWPYHSGLPALPKHRPLSQAVCPWPNMKNCTACTKGWRGFCPFASLQARSQRTCLSLKRQSERIAYCTGTWTKPKPCRTPFWDARRCAVSWSCQGFWAKCLLTQQHPKLGLVVRAGVGFSFCGVRNGSRSCPFDVANVCGIENKSTYAFIPSAAAWRASHLKNKSRPSHLNSCRYASMLEAACTKLSLAAVLPLASNQSLWWHLVSWSQFWTSEPPLTFQCIGQSKPEAL